MKHALNLRYENLSLAHSVREDSTYSYTCRSRKRSLSDAINPMARRNRIANRRRREELGRTEGIRQELESVLGSDLQYIRMNGTIVGALVGCVIFLVSDASLYKSWVRDWLR